MVQEPGKLTAECGTSSGRSLSPPHVIIDEVRLQQASRPKQQPPGNGACVCIRVYVYVHVCMHVFE